MTYFKIRRTSSLETFRNFVTSATLKTKDAIAHVYAKIGPQVFELSLTNSTKKSIS